MAQVENKLMEIGKTENEITERAGVECEVVGGAVVGGY